MQSFGGNYNGLYKSSKKSWTKFSSRNSDDDSNIEHEY